MNECIIVDFGVSLSVKVPNDWKSFSAEQKKSFMLDFFLDHMNTSKSYDVVIHNCQDDPDLVD